MFASVSINFEYEPAGPRGEPRLTMTLDNSSTYSVRGEEAEKLWREVEQVRDEFTGPPQLAMRRGTE